MLLLDFWNFTCLDMRDAKGLIFLAAAAAGMRCSMNPHVCFHRSNTMRV